jgi:phosphoglycolate phosphatase-like HAD superfamily hydrolase
MAERFSRKRISTVRELAIFDLDGTLVEIGIKKEDLEGLRFSWSEHLKARYGIHTSLRPILPELRRIAGTPEGKPAASEILTCLDQLEVNAPYRALGSIDNVLNVFRENFKKIVLISHNSYAFWSRLQHENSWPALIDIVLVRDFMEYLKPDVRVCGNLLEEVTEQRSDAECWIIGNSLHDWELGANIRTAYPMMRMRRFLVTPGMTQPSVERNQSDAQVAGIDCLIEFASGTDDHAVSFTA